uniref:PHD finger protein 10 n=1 Tax=Magallana gigas TaxID=29159 RepID=K1PNK1_MAGGI
MFPANSGLLMENVSSLKQPEGSYITSNYEASQAAQQGNQSLTSQGVDSSVRVPHDGERAFKAISEGKAWSDKAVVLENKSASQLSTGLSQLGDYSSGSDSEEAENSKAADEAIESRVADTQNKFSSETSEQSKVSGGDSKKVMNIDEEAMECTETKEEIDQQSKELEADVTKSQIIQDKNEDASSDKDDDKKSEVETSQDVSRSILTDRDQDLADPKASAEKSDVSELTASERSKRSESTGFDVQDPVDTPAIRKPSKVEMIDEESNASFIKLDGKTKDSPLNFDVPPSPYGVSEISETPGPGTPASVVSNGDSVSYQAFDNFGPPTPSSVADNSSMGPTPSKRSRLAVYTPSQEHITASKLFEYQWPTDGSGEYYMLQEQLVSGDYQELDDLFRRQVDIKERVFLMDKGVVTEGQADLGLTALKSDEVCDLMHKDYPEMYQEYAEVLHERQKQKISEKHKEYEVPKLEKSKMSLYIKKAMKSAAEWNSSFQKERREERKAYLDLQTFNIHYPQGRYKVLPKEMTKPIHYPVSLIPGQFQNYFKRYSTDELKYFPMNTAMFDPPKRMGTTLANPQEQPEPETASEEDENGSGSDSDSDDSSSGSEGTSGAEDGEKKSGETKEAAPVDSSVCSICTQGQNSEVKGESDLVVCSECNKGGHPGCLDLTNEMDKMMFCDLCDRGYHTFCVGLKSIPTGHWKCKSCKGPETPKPSKSSKTPKSSKSGTGKKRGRPPLKKKDKKKSKKKIEPKEEAEDAEDDTAETKEDEEGEEEGGEEKGEEGKGEEEEEEEMEAEESQE